MRCPRCGRYATPARPCCAGYWQPGLFARAEMLARVQRRIAELFAWRGE